MRDAVLLAAVFVVLITALFLSGWRRVLVLVLSLPVTVLGTFFLMWLLGFSVNIFTLGGLVVAMTVVLDNSVVMLENITRLQENKSETKYPVSDGAIQVTGAIVTATITFLLLFIPLLLIPSLSSLLFRELVITVAIVIFLSMIVSLTVTPMLMNLLYPSSRNRVFKKGFISRGADFFIRGLVRLYRPVLRFSLRFKWTVVLAFLLLLIPGYYYLTRTGSEFLPKADDGLITINIVMPTGTSMEETDRALGQVAEVVTGQDYIKGYATLAGGKVWGLVTTETSFLGEINIELVPASQRPMNTDEYVEILRPKVMKAVKVPGAVIKVMLAKMKGIRQTGQFEFEVEISAPRSVSMQNIYNTAVKVRNEIRDFDFLTGLDISLQITKPEYQVRVDRHRAIELGISYQDVANTVKTMVGGNVPTRYKEGAYYYPVRVVMDEKEIESPEALDNLYIYSGRGVKISLSAVADVVKTTGPVQIDRQDQDLPIKVTANVADMSVGEATGLIREKLQSFDLPSGFTISYGGQSQMLSENFRQIAIILVFALFLGYAVMVLYFESFIKPLLIIIRIPLSLAGISFALYITGTPVSVTALIGIIMLTGMEINNGVLLLSFIDELRGKGLEIREAVTQAALIRLRPIFITNINSLAGLLPLALTMGDGTEMLKPMAIVVIGGVLFGLLLVFIFLPAAYMSVYSRSRQVQTTRAT